MISRGFRGGVLCQTVSWPDSPPKPRCNGSVPSLEPLSFLTRKMSRVAVIWTPRTASACQELLELLELVRSWFMAWTGASVPFISATEVMSNWRWAETQMTLHVVAVFLSWNFTGNIKCHKIKKSILPLTKMENMQHVWLHIWRWISHVQVA